MTLQECKLLLDWTKQKLDIIRGARLSNPEEYNKWYNYHELVGEVYDEMCENLINEMIEKNRSL